MSISMSNGARDIDPRLTDHVLLRVKRTNMAASQKLKILILTRVVTDLVSYQMQRPCQVQAILPKARSKSRALCPFRVSRIVPKMVKFSIG